MIEWKAIKALDIATHPEKTRYAMTGIHVCRRGMTATDGKILVHRAWAPDDITPGLANALGDAGRVILATDMPKVKRGRSTFLNVDAILESVPVDGHFPPWSDVIPAQTARKLTECRPQAWDLMAEFAGEAGDGAWLIQMGEQGHKLRAARRYNGLTLRAEQGEEHRDTFVPPCGWGLPILRQVASILETAELGVSYFGLPNDGRSAMLLVAGRGGAVWKIVAMPAHVPEDVRALLAA